MNTAEIRARLENNQIPFGLELPERLETYFQLLLEWNERMDLVARAPEAELWDRHFQDSLTGLRTGLLAGASRLIDVGTGAGFPGMVLALACPEREVTLLDSQQKRLTFLEEVAQRTGAENVTLIHARAEDGARRPELREGFDLAVARAVAPLNVLCEYLLPYVRVGGKALCWKGPGVKEELEAGRKAAYLLGGRLGELVSAPVEGQDWEHLLLPIEKLRSTPKMYPRRAGMPKSSPL